MRRCAIAFVYFRRRYRTKSRFFAMSVLRKNEKRTLAVHRCKTDVTQTNIPGQFPQTSTVAFKNTRPTLTGRQLAPAQSGIQTTCRTSKNFSKWTSSFDNHRYSQSPTQEFQETVRKHAFMGARCLSRSNTTPPEEHLYQTYFQTPKHSPLGSRSPKNETYNLHAKNSQPTGKLPYFFAKKRFSRT